MIINDGVNYIDNGFIDVKHFVKFVKERLSQFSSSHEYLVIHALHERSHALVNLDKLSEKIELSDNGKRKCRRTLIVNPVSWRSVGWWWRELFMLDHRLYYATFSSFSRFSTLQLVSYYFFLFFISFSFFLFVSAVTCSTTPWIMSHSVNSSAENLPSRRLFSYVFVVYLLIVFNTLSCSALLQTAWNESMSTSKNSNLNSKHVMMFTCSRKTRKSFVVAAKQEEEIHLFLV